MQDDYIAVGLELPQLQILEQRELADHFEVVVMYRQDAVICPRCGQITNKEQDRRPQRKKDRMLRDKEVFLILMKRRFRCPSCGKVFTEPDAVGGWRRRSTQRFREYLGEEALHQTARRVAQKEGVGEGLVRRCVAEEVGRRLKVSKRVDTPEFIGVDEFSVRKNYLYHTAICNLREGEIMEVIEGRGQKRLEEYWDKLPSPERVKAVAIDMHEPFRQAIWMTLPQAKIVVDKFHFLKQVQAALDKVRSRLQKGEDRNKRRELFRSSFTLLRGREKLTEEEKEKLRKLFFLYPELQKAWMIKESFRIWYGETERSRERKN